MKKQGRARSRTVRGPDKHGRARARDKPGQRRGPVKMDEQGVGRQKDQTNKDNKELGPYKQGRAREIDEHG